MHAAGVTKRLEVPGGTIAYEERGRGAPVVLLHEGIADRRMWNREFPLLARDHRVVRYDLRGYGGSVPATAQFSFVRDLVAVLDAVGAQRPLIVGPSMGGRIALDLALAHPDRVGALLLIAPGYSGMDYDHVPGGKATFERDETLSKAAADAWAAGRPDEATEHLRQLWAASLTGDALDLWRTMVRENAPEVFEDRSA
jgi:pimeloyl-ACP methyl ester carboxylesterase